MAATDPRGQSSIEPFARGFIDAAQIACDGLRQKLSEKH